MNRASTSLIYRLLQHNLPDESSPQWNAQRQIPPILSQLSHPITILDLGCGQGHSHTMFEKYAPGICWMGLDIVGSPETQGRKQIPDRNLCSYDGVRIPFKTASFDLIYSSQVFEHVRHPEPLLKDVRRVLKPGGLFFGSTSSLEPFHSYSYWNYSPFGFIELLKDAELNPIEVRPGIDAVTMLLRQALNKPKIFNRWFTTESPLNRLLSIYARVKRLKHSETNALKLQFAGIFFFVAKA